MMQYLRIVSFIGLALLLSGCNVFLPTNETIPASPQLKAGETEIMEEDSKDKVDAINDDSIMEDEGDLMMESEDVMIEENNISYNGTVLAGSKTKLIDFNKADYEKAITENQNIVLYFYASWCPICKNETTNALYPAFNELEVKNTVGFRVNYNDSDTDSDEEALAQKFGVAYQHTKVFVKNGERILKSPASWDKSQYLEEIIKLAQ